jgi:hypothetical protein
LSVVDGAYQSDCLEVSGHVLMAPNANQFFSYFVDTTTSMFEKLVNVAVDEICSPDQKIEALTPLRQPPRFVSTQPADQVGREERPGAVDCYGGL